MRAGLRSLRGLEGEKEADSSISVLTSALMGMDFLVAFRAAVEVEARLRFNAVGTASSMSSLSSGSDFDWSKENLVCREVLEAAAMALAVSLDILEVLMLDSVDGGMQFPIWGSGAAFLPAPLSPVDFSYQDQIRSESPRGVGMVVHIQQVVLFVCEIKFYPAFNHFHLPLACKLLLSRCVDEPLLVMPWREATSLNRLISSAY